MTNSMQPGVFASKQAIEKKAEFWALYRTVSAAKTEIEAALRSTPDAQGYRLTRAALVRALSAQKRVARTMAGLVGL
jgi:hypothetical protein